MYSKKQVVRPLMILLLAVIACRLPGNRQVNEPQEPPAAATQELPATESVVTSDRLDRYQINAEQHPDAVCNDGTVPVFYFRRGVGDGANKWIIWFKGGGTGYSAETFQGRGPTITSSDPWMQEEYATLGSTGNQGSPDGEAGGIMSADPGANPDFYTWNHVYLVYCSSDGWAGTRAASPASGNIHFAGHFIVNAMFDALADPDIVGTPNLADASHVILSGSSAGALGLRSNVDRLAENQLSHADVRAISDAGVFLFGNPDMETVMETTIQQQYEVWQPVLDEGCTAEQIDEPWRCLTGSFLVQNGYIQTPMFIHQDQSDVKLAEAFAATGLDVDANLVLVGEATRPLLETQDGVFSPNAGRHIIVNSNRFNGFRLEGKTFAEVFGNWYFDRSGPTQLIEYP